MLEEQFKHAGTPRVQYAIGLEVCGMSSIYTRCSRIEDEYDVKNETRTNVYPFVAIAV